SKFAVVGFTESLAQELAPRGVHAQAVFPGPVTTPLVDDTMLSKPFGGSIPAEHFADAVVALAHTPGDAVVVHPHILPVRQAD
ncbi:MAG: SDR family oxidoreductase, partial [Pseudomonadota bacterium]